MRLLQIGMATMILLLGTAAAGQSAKQLLPTGQAITPLAAPGARFTPLVARTGPHPAYAVDGAAAIAVSPDNREMLILTSGFNRYNGRDSKPVEKSQPNMFFATRSAKAALDGFRHCRCPTASAELPGGRTGAASSSAAGWMMYCIYSSGAARGLRLRAE